MSKRDAQPDLGRSATIGKKVGRERFAKISEVEGITLTPAMKRRAADFDRAGLSPEQRIRAIIAVHRKD